MGQDRRGGRGVGEGVVGSVEGDAVVLAQVAQAVRPLPIGVEPAGHAQRAQRVLETRRTGSSAGRRGGPAQEAAVEVGVVGGEDGAVETVAELGEHVVERRRALERAAGDAVHVRGPDPLQRPAQLDQRRPFVDDGAVGLDRDQADLQDAVPARGQARRLQVDDGEARATITRSTLDTGCRQRPELASAVRCRASREARAD